MLQRNASFCKKQMHTLTHNYYAVQSNQLNYFMNSLNLVQGKERFEYRFELIVYLSLLYLLVVFSLH